MMGWDRSRHGWRMVLGGVCAILSVTPGPDAWASERLTIYTVNYPLQYFAQRIAGEHAEVVYPGPTDEDPAFWKPATETVLAYQQADLILLNGAAYAKWVEKVSLPRLRTVDTSAAFRDRLIRTDGAATHSHGPTGDHSHAGTAFTTWLDLRQAAEQAKAIHAALVRKLPDKEQYFNKNYNELTDELNLIDDLISRTINDGVEGPILASHPVYQYLARAYGLDLESVLWEPGVMPAEGEWEMLDRLLEDHTAQLMLWESEPIEEIVEHLEARDVSSVVFDPCSTAPETGDFMTVMRRNVESLRQAIE